MKPLFSSASCSATLASLCQMLHSHERLALPEQHELGLLAELVRSVGIFLTSPVAPNAVLKHLASASGAVRNHRQPLSGEPQPIGFQFVTRSQVGHVHRIGRLIAVFIPKRGHSPNPTFTS